MQILQRRQGFQNISDGDVDGEHPARLLLTTLTQRRTRHILHDNKTGRHPGVINKIVGLHNHRVGDVGQKLAFRNGSPNIMRIPRPY